MLYFLPFSLFLKMCSESAVLLPVIGLYPYAQEWPILTLPCRACGPVYAPRLYAEVDSSNLAENDGITKLVDSPCHDFYESVCVSSHQLVLYSILTAASTLAMVMGVPVFIGT